MNNYYFIFGSKEHPEGAVKALEEKGAKPGSLNCDLPWYVYFINGDGQIDFVCKDSTLGKMLVEFGTQLFPIPNYKFNIGNKVLLQDNVCVIKGTANKEGEPYYNIFGHSDLVPETDLAPYVVPEPQLHPFQKVLARNFEDEPWWADIYSHYDAVDERLHHVCVGHSWTFCIPYQGNEHLLGTAIAPENVN